MKPKDRYCLVSSLLALAGAAQAQTEAPTESVLPRPGFLQAQPAAIEVNWTPLKLPTNERIALLGASYLVAMNEDWGIGPSFYGAAKGNFGGIFTVGFTAQRRWRLGNDLHAAAGVYAGAGGGLSSDKVRFGGGLMLRPELSLRREFGNWYSGVSLAHTTFPNGRGNVKDTTLGFVLGYSDGFVSYAPTESGRRVETLRRSGLGFDEVSLSVGSYSPRSGAKNRGGSPARRVGKAGGMLRQYVTEGAWWGLEAAGAAQGGADGYMEVLLGLGQDYGLGGNQKLRAGWHVATGLGGGGDIDTGNGWLVKGGPTLRWKTPWGPSLHLDAGVMGSLTGSFKSTYARVSLGLPLDQGSGVFGQPNDAPGVVRTQTVYASLQRLSKVRFKDGRQENVGHLAMVLTRDLGSNLYGVAQAGSAAFGSAGAYSFGLFGLGVQGKPWARGPKIGAEMMVGAAGGGGVAISGGAAAQAEAWAQWEFGAQDRIRLRTGVGQWRSLRGQTQSTPLVNVSLGYAFGAVTR
ncbi:hypothetical protein G8A07_04960 [Roseateles sp. DAIF2]|uniref:hypothetical protein n=1 Tax=Roseateles sp. DAIF2 TaxID=2714952 RepID=UPI0018A2FBCD|nr:hypothetical protein [Roseateles sp. DAIF2]QPF72346.1 hypothetical protein G8A07_04960 [Roseateles sp. DAIF2]